MDKIAAGRTSVDKSLNKFLSKDDAFTLLEIMDASIMCKEQDDFKDLLRNFGAMFGAKYSLCFLAALNQEGRVSSIEVLNSNFPQDWLKLYMSKCYYNVDPVAIENFRNYDVQYWANTYSKCSPPPELVRYSFKAGLKQGYSCGARGNNGEKNGSLFLFSGDSIDEHPRTQVILKYSVPFLHESLSRRLRASSLSSQNVLTQREKEILGCIRDGMTDVETAIRLKITDNTVKFHVKNILYKLNASSRYHALSIAFQNNYISI